MPAANQGCGVAGFSVSASPHRQSSDSAFSYSNHTDLSAKPSSVTERSTPAPRARKRSVESVASTRSRDNSFRSKPSAEKRPRVESGNTSVRESDCDNDDSVANYSDAGSDSNEPLTELIKEQVRCEQCDRVFPSRKGMLIHVKRCHSKTLGVNAVVNIPPEKSTPKKEEANDEDGQACDKCGKTFKLKIMLKRHNDACNGKPSPIKKELQVTLEPISINTDKKIDCKMCTTKFKTVDNLEKHMRVCHAAVLKKPAADQPAPAPAHKKVPVPCVFCNKHFDDYYVHAVHFNSCARAVEMNTFECKVCKKVFSRKNAYFIHIKNFHFEPRAAQTAKATDVGAFECRMCNKKLASKEALITHLAAHMSHIDEPASVDEESR